MAHENQVFCPRSLRALHQLNQHATHIFGVDENNRRAMRANARLSRAQHPRALCHQLVARGEELLASARAAFGKPPREWAGEEESDDDDE